MLAISMDPPAESAKMDSLLKGAFPLLADPDLAVSDAYGMAFPMGSQRMSAMGYAIVDRQGQLRHREIDPLFGDHAPRILETLRSATP